VSDFIKTKLTPVYWFESGIIALCDKESIAGCDADDDCSKCEHNLIGKVLANGDEKALKRCNIQRVRVMLPDNVVPHDIAKEFTDTKLKVVNTLLSDDYKTGYREGITHFIEAKCN